MYYPAGFGQVPSSGNDRKVYYRLFDGGDDDGSLQKGVLATDPATLVFIYFSGTDVFNLTYLSNGYV